MVLWLVCPMALATDWTAVSDLAFDPSELGADDAALVVAVEDYDRVPKAAVPGATEVGRAWARWLEEGRGLAPDRIRTLFGEQAKRESLEQGARWLSEQAPGGTAWVIYAGQGAISAEGTDRLILGADAEVSVVPLSAYGVSLRELQSWVSGPHAVFVLDTSFGGRSLEGPPTFGRPDLVRLPPLEPRAGVTMVVSALPTEPLRQLPDLPVPAFSYLMLGALSGWGVETAGEAIDLQGAVGFVEDTLASLEHPLSPRILGPSKLPLGQGTPGARPEGLVASERSPFADVLGADISSVLEGRRCGNGAAEAAEVHVVEELAEEAVRLRMEATRAWSQLEPVLRRCLQPAGEEPAPGRAELKARCVEQVAAFTTAAQEAVARVPAGEVEVEVEGCEGPQTARFAAREEPVTIPEVAPARELWSALSGIPLEPPPPGTVEEGVLGPLVYVPGGAFTMGSPVDDAQAYPDERPAHEVEVGGLMILRAEVTQAAWEALMGGNPSSHASCGADCPVDSVSWLDAVALANAASKAEGLEAAYTISASGMVTQVPDALGYRLLTEAEWEHAARGGEGFPFAGHEQASRVGWVRDNAEGAPRAGCTKQANGYGLCDLTGNVAEWVFDEYRESYDAGAEPQAGKRVIRGGSYNVPGRSARVTARNWLRPGASFDYVGVRLAKPHRHL